MEDRQVTNPLVSVIIPCHNHGIYLEEAYASIVNQTYSPIETILVDDGSEDLESVRTFEAKHTPNIKVLYTEHRGPSAARNAAIKEAKGKYILPLDADDRVAPTYIEKAVAILEESQDVGIVYCRAEFFGAMSGEWALPEYSLYTMLQRNIIFCTAVFRREDWEQCGGYGEDMIYGLEDYDFWLSLIEMGKKVYKIPEILFFYRKHNTPSLLYKLQNSREKLTYSNFRIIEHHINLYRHYKKFIVPILLKSHYIPPYKVVYFKIIKLLSALIPIPSLRREFRKNFIDL